jgi:hypothetical protein
MEEPSLFVLTGFGSGGGPKGKDAKSKVKKSYLGTLSCRR